MNIGQQLLFLTSALGAINGLLLSLYLFISRKRKSLPAVLLGFLLLSMSLRVAKSVAVYFNQQLPVIYKQLGLSACFFIGPSLYFFIRSGANSTLKPHASWKWHWGILAAIVIIGGIRLPYAIYPQLWNGLIVQIIYLQWGIYTLAAGYEIWKDFRYTAAATKSMRAALQFRLLVYMASACIYTLYLMAMHICSVYMGGALCFTFFLYLTILFYLQNADLENILHVQMALSFERLKKQIPDTEAQARITQLEKVLLETELYKNPNLKLNDLAQKINISAHQLSQLLNDNLGKNFSAYINEYRINAACQLIATHPHLTLEAIGYEVGYNSKSTFYTAFKKVKDTTPAFYKESLARAANG